MEKKKKAANTKNRRGRALRRGNNRGANNPRARSQSQNRGLRGVTRTNFKNKNNQMFRNRNGRWAKGARANVRGGFAKKRFNKNQRSNLTRSQSNSNLNKIKRGGFGNRRGGRFGLKRSRSRSNLNANGFLPKNGLTKRTNSMSNLNDPNSVYNRLGYQSQKQIAYRNRVKRAKQLLIQRQNKVMGNPNRFMVIISLKF